MGASCGRRKSSRSQPEFKYHASSKKDPKQLKRRNFEDPHILIIGAGAAGLACAVSLLDNDFRNVRIAEASGRIGGRILTTTFADVTIDLGAQWVHGQRNNVVYEEVYQRDLLDSSMEQYRQIDFIRSDGHKLPEAVVEELLGIMATIFRNRQNDLFMHTGSFSSYLTLKFNEALAQEQFKHIDKALASEFLCTFKKREGATVGCSDEMSCEGLDNFMECEGDAMLNWKEEGFLNYLNVLIGASETNKLGKLRNVIDFNCKATKIDWDNYDGSVMVFCANGKHYLVDHVIVTVPLGVLRRNLTFFSPQLPSDKRRAINYTGFGNACKIYFEFRETFWPTEWSGFHAVWSESDVRSMIKAKQEWMCDILGFYPVNRRPMLLQAWAIGCSVELIETMPTDELLRAAQTILSKFLVDWRVASPVKVVTSKFTVDENFLGAYSYSSVLTQRYYTGADELMQPINVMAMLPMENVSQMTLLPMTVRPLILFAGEATSRHHFSTVHGAVETGRREAARLIGYYWKDL